MPFGDYEDFDSCVSSNSDKADPEAYCAGIKREVEGEQALSKSEQKALESSDCPDGQVKLNDQCVPVEEVENVPPSSLKNSTAVYQLASLESEPIEREELSETKVAYRNLKILQSGVWRDSESKQAIWYSPRGLENMELTDDTSVNIMHDDNNEVSEAGELKNLRAEDGSLFADVIIDTSNSAGSYADENMQQTLASEGAKGFGGPSIEIPPEGQQVEYNPDKGVKELRQGKIKGLGLVSNPASKPTSFARQAGTRAVALSDSDRSVMQLQEKERYMADVETVREVLEGNGIDTGDMTDEEVMAIGEELMSEYSEEEEVENQEDEEDEEDETDDEPPEEEPPEEDPDDEEEEMDMENKIQSLEERLTNLEDMAEQAMAAEDVEETLSEELESAKEELADAETVNELAEAKEELDKRLSQLEEEPEDPRSLSGENGGTNADSEGPGTIIHSYDSRRGEITR